MASSSSVFLSSSSSREFEWFVIGVQHPSYIHGARHVLRHPPMDTSTICETEMQTCATLVKGYAVIAHEISQSVELFIEHIPPRVRYIFKCLAYAKHIKIDYEHVTRDTCMIMNCRCDIVQLYLDNTTFKVEQGRIRVLCETFFDYSHCKMIDVNEVMAMFDLLNSYYYN
jgi:hypothetical protein